MDNTDSALCSACHRQDGWSAAAHQPPAAKCESCHTSHNAGEWIRLLKGPTEEETCTAACHNGTGPGADVAADFAKFSVHPLSAASAVHDAAENPLNADFHVECADCHDPHEANAATASPPDVSGALKGVKGVDVTASIVDPAQAEYEICYRCHADNSFVSQVAIARQVQQVNQRLRFDSANPSYHPVTAPTSGTDVPSLRSQIVGTTRSLSSSSQIYCSDCHNSDSGTLAGGSGPDGPHGSSWPHLLIDRYEQETYPLLPYSVDFYALCYRCHDDQALLSSTSPFPKHDYHVMTEGVPCSVCHDPHGIYWGDAVSDHAHLVNFDTAYVDPATADYDSAAQSCTVSCHAANPKTY